MDSRAIKNRIVWLDQPSEFVTTAGLDIELPLRTRTTDGDGQQRAQRRAEPRVARLPEKAPPALDCAYPSLAAALLTARPGPYGLDVEVKQDERVVGTWALDVTSRDAAGVHVSQASATLHVCVSVCGDPRATGAFLVLSQWWVNAGDEEQARKLYGELTSATLVRLTYLAEGISDDADSMPPYVLYLVDGRSRKVKFFSLGRLASKLLHALGDDHGIPGLKLQIAYGRGLGSSPVAPTMPAELGVLDQDVVVKPRSPDLPWNPASGRRVGPGEAFVREQLSPENVRWSRKFAVQRALT